LQDIQELLDEAPQGVIYFSLGTMLRSETFPPEVLRTFLAAFTRLPFRVLWKCNADKMPAVPSNVFMRSWVPQKDVLGNRSFMCAIYNWQRAFTLLQFMYYKQLFKEECRSLRQIEILHGCLGFKKYGESPNYLRNQ
jgi:hypothetical protein